MTLRKAMRRLYAYDYFVHFNWEGVSLTYMISDFYGYEGYFIDNEVRIQKREGRYHVYIKEVKEHETA